MPHSRCRPRPIPHALMTMARARTRNPTGKRPRPSPAPSSSAGIWRCAPPKAPHDIDIRYDDLVDVVVVTPDGRAAADQVQDIERRLRELADRRARVFTPMERDRRARAIQVLTRAQCAEGCTLVQSRMWLK